MNLLNNLLSSDWYTPVNKMLAKKLWFIIAWYFWELIRQRKRFWEEEFYFSQKQMWEEIWISEYEQRKCVKVLKEVWFIEVNKKWLPARYFFKINDELVINFFNNQSFKIWSTSDLKNELHNNNKEIINNNNNILDKSNIEQSSEIILKNSYEENWIEKFWNKEINDMQEFIKEKVSEIWFIYKKWKYERWRIKNLLQSKEIKELLEKYNMTIYDFIWNIILLSSKLNFWNWKIYNAESLYKHYATILNESLKLKQEKEKNNIWITEI